MWDSLLGLELKTDFNIAVLFQQYTFTSHPIV